MAADASGSIGSLLLVATPIGNMGDLGPRAREEIEDADIVFAEDTRRSAKIVGTGRRVYSFHDHNVAGRLPQLRGFLSEGRKVALVSDAGMPGISDPAYAAVRSALECGASIRVVPGPSAPVTALVASGLPVARFCFEGFLPRKKGPRKRRLQKMAEYTGTLIYFVGPHHLVRLLGECREVLGDRRACVAREMTKIHEEYVRGTLLELEEIFCKDEPRGEITLVVGGNCAD